MDKRQMESLAERHGEQIIQWSHLWQVVGLEKRLKIQWSRQMWRSLGRCAPSKSLIRISTRLAIGPPEILLEVLCHEAAHVAVHEIQKKRCRPHGPEWAQLMKAAGYEPRTAIFIPPTIGEMPPRRHQSRYLHRCPVCGAARIAKTSAARWRCARCREAGLDGHLAISPLPNSINAQR